MPVYRSLCNGLTNHIAAVDVIIVLITADGKAGDPLEICVHNLYSQTSLVSTPGDPPNCYSLSVVLANHID